MNLSQTLEAARNVLRFRQMSYRTEQSYLHWIKRFGFWCLEHRDGDHQDKARGYLTHLALALARVSAEVVGNSRWHHVTV